MNRQGYLERALDWVSKGDIGSYMSAHRNDNNINGLKTYFNSVIDWVSSVFRDVAPEMRGLEWGRLYEEYHSKSYDPAKVSSEVKRLYADPYVKTVAASSNTFSEVQPIRNCWMSVFLTKRQRNRLCISD